MNYAEYGKGNSNVIILLHGGGFSWWNYKEIAEMLQTNYHIIIPILDGHAGSDKRFTTIENNALEIIEFINDKLDGSVLLIGGLSLGGQILLEILSHRKDICKYAIVESALVIPSKFTYFMIKPAFGSCYGLIKYKWFSKLQFKSLRIKQHWFDEWNTRGTVLQWDIKQFFHKENKTIVEWYFKNQMKNGTVEAFDGVSLIEWTNDNKILFLKEFGCNINNYDPYQYGDKPQFRDEKVGWF